MQAFRYRLSLNRWRLFCQVIGSKITKWFFLYQVFGIKSYVVKNILTWILTWNRGRKALKASISLDLLTLCKSSQKIKYPGDLGKKEFE